MDFLYEPHGILLLSLQLVAVLFSVDTPGAVLCLMEFPAQSLMVAHSLRCRGVHAHMQVGFND